MYDPTCMNPGISRFESILIGENHSVEHNFWLRINCMCILSHFLNSPGGITMYMTYFKFPITNLKGMVAADV